MLPALVMPSAKFFAPRVIARFVTSGVRVACVVAPLATVGCLAGRFDTPDPQPAANMSTTQVIDQIFRERKAHQLPAPIIVPDLRALALRDIVTVSRGDETLATAAHAVALRGVQTLGRETWAYATDCANLAELHLPPPVLASHELLVNAAAVAGRDGRTYVLIVVTEPGTSAIRADQLGGGAGGTNPSLESYVHPATAPGRCGERWPGSQRAPS